MFLFLWRILISLCMNQSSGQRIYGMWVALRHLLFVFGNLLTCFTYNVVRYLLRLISQYLHDKVFSKKFHLFIKSFSIKSIKSFPCLLPFVWVKLMSIQNTLRSLCGHKYFSFAWAHRNLLCELISCRRPLCIPLSNVP